MQDRIKALEAENAALREIAQAVADARFAALSDDTTMFAVTDMLDLKAKARALLAKEAR